MNSFLPANARKEKIVKPLGATSPWVWSLEPTHGCNLRCGHCNCRLDPLPKTYDFMGEETWRKAWAIIARTAPTCRVDLCVGGEPTLNESLPDFLKIAREISPRTQIQITTNGTMIASGHVTYKQLLDAGANIVYTDMYSPAELFHRLADESGYPSYEYYNPPPQAPSPWTYWGPQLKMIVLQEQPENWPETRFRAGLLGTWYNAAVIDPAKILVLDKVKYQDAYETYDELGYAKSKGPGAARNFAWDHAIAAGHDWHWVMDDNIRRFYRFDQEQQIPVGDGTIFRAMEDFALRFENVAMAGPNYFMFVPRKDHVCVFSLNTRIYSCNLIRNELPYRWRGRYNEDTDLSLRMLKAGWCTVQFNCFLQLKAPTQTVKGGCNKDFYQVEGTLPKSQMLVRMHPDVTKLKWKFNRWHHEVDYRVFRHNRLRLKHGVEIPSEADDYGMRLAVVS
jgi:hypothetical protein